MHSAPRRDDVRLFKEVRKQILMCQAEETVPVSGTWITWNCGWLPGAILRRRMRRKDVLGGKKRDASGLDPGQIIVKPPQARVCTDSEYGHLVFFKRCKHT